MPLFPGSLPLSLSFRPNVSFYGCKGIADGDIKWKKNTCTIQRFFSPMLSQMNFSLSSAIRFCPLWITPLDFFSTGTSKITQIWNPNSHLPTPSFWGYSSRSFSRGVLFFHLNFLSPPSFAGTSWPFVASHTSFTWTIPMILFTPNDPVTAVMGPPVTAKFKEVVFRGTKRFSWLF